MPAPLQPRMFLLQPTTVFAARVNQPSAAEYPVFSVVYNTVTTGAFTDILPGMTLLLGSAAGLDDYGRQRVREVNGAGATAIVVWVGRSSPGTNDGELTIVDNAYVTVLDDRRVWAKIPFIDSAGEIFKDGNLEVNDRTTDPPPVAIMGAGFAATIDDGTSLITVSFDGTASYAVADAATITTYLWDVGDGTITVGTSASSGITATFPAGFRYVSLKVTDSNTNSHTAYRPVFARDPDDDDSFDAFQIESIRKGEAGQSMSVRVLDDMPRTTYPDGTLAMVWGKEPSSATDRNHMLIIGWLDSENANINMARRGLLRNTTISILDVAGRLDRLPGFPQSVADDDSRDVGVIPDITWSFMIAPNLDKYLHYLLHWHSNALDVADFVWSGDGADYPFVLQSSDGTSLWGQVDRVARTFVPDRVLTCDRAGRLAIVADPMLANVADRTATVQAAIDESKWSQITFAYQRAPRVHWVRSNADLALAYADLPLDAELVPYIPRVYSIAPGDTPGQGLGEIVQGSQLAINQTALNTATGHRYARSNARVGLITITLIVNDSDADADIDWLEIEPAWKEWVTITVSAETAAQRGLTWTTIRGLPKELLIRPNYSRFGTTRTITLTVELETTGEPGQTVIPPEVPVVGVQPEVPPPVEWTPPLPGDTEFYYGNMAGYILWDGAAVLRTWDLQDASPTWELVDTGISGTIYDGQYMHVDADTVGMWLLTDASVYFCADIMATTPSWSEKLTIATVRGIADAPAAGDVIFASMTHVWVEPGHLCVAMSLDTENDDYLHAWYWVTEDYGANWTPVDMNAFTFGTAPTERCYYMTGRYSLASFRSEPILWCGRANGKTGTSSGDSAIFKSIDGGLTWTMEHSFAQMQFVNFIPAILNPFPSIGDPTYLSRGFGISGAVAQTFISTDAWATATLLVEPATHSGGYEFDGHLQRGNKHTFDNTHIMMLFEIDSSANGDLYESFDQGATWNLLRNFNNNTVMPNGWPPDVDQWVVIFNGPSTPRIQLTLDNFANMLDKTGNLASIVTWTNGNIAGGFALPKVAPNV